jgi:type IV pilus assembly protein PilY1
VADDTEKDTLIKFIHGLDAYDDNGNGNTTEKRQWIMGDILHSKPKIINYNSYDFNATSENNCTWSGTDPYNKTVVYVGANDGMLHAFRDCDGEELWAFIPPDILPDLKNLRGAGHRIFVDGTPTAYIYDADDDGNIESGDKVILLFGLRRGGGAYYALDVTDPETPKYLWKIDSSNSDFAQLGQSWSTPTLGKIKNASNEDLIVAFIGAGYDNDNEDGRYGNTQGFTDADVVIPTADAGPTAKTSTGTTVLPRDGSAALTNSPKGRGVYAFKVATLNSSGVPTIATSPVKVWDFTYANSGTNATLVYNAKRLMYSIPADVAALDTDYDGYIDRLYVGDTGGQMWRISAYHPNSGTDPYLPYARAVINTTNDPWFGKIIFDANAALLNSSDKGRKIFYKPSVTLEKGGTYGVYFGTGDRAHPLNTAVTDRLYGLIDRGQKTSEEIDEDVLVNVTDNCLQASSDTCVGSTLDALLTDTSKYGWYIKLSDRAGEKVLADALAFNKVAYYTTYRPVATNANSCTPGNLGESRLYAVDYKTGEAVLNFDEDNDTDAENATAGNRRALSKEGKVLRKEDRSVRLGVGIPSGLVVLMPPSGDAELLIGCGGGLCSEDPVAGGTVIPIYWMAW